MRVRLEGEVDRLNDSEGLLLALPPEPAVLLDHDPVAAGFDVVEDELEGDRHPLEVLVSDSKDFGEVLEIKFFEKFGTSLELDDIASEIGLISSRCYSIDETIITFNHQRVDSILFTLYVVLI